MEFAISAVTTVQPSDRFRLGDSPASRQQDVLENHARPSTPAAERSEPDVDRLKRAAEQINQALRTFDRDLAISIHDDGQVVVRVTDPATGDVIRQIPPERVLEVEENLNRIVGLFVNDQA